MADIEKHLAAETNHVLRRRAWYHATAQSFFATPYDTIIGALTLNSARDGFEVNPEQANAWREEIVLLQEIVPRELQCDVFIEFGIPRMGRRIDALLLFENNGNPCIVILEFKIGKQGFLQNDINQVWDYALDLKNFHKGSHNAKVIPILVATISKEFSTILDYAPDGIASPLTLGIEGVASLLCKLGEEGVTRSISEWENSAYSPTPTIIEAARSLYSQHRVENITRNDAGAINIKQTSNCVSRLIEQAAQNKQKLICFVTGVPGAGKTLVGLNVATLQHGKIDKTHAVYLSGNGPLVAVLNEALVRDEQMRLAASGQRKRKGDIAVKVKSFIQNVHHFRDEAIRNAAAPSEHVVIFDEAQRAWNLTMTRNFMQRKKKIHGFNQSEPDFLISYMDRHSDWAVIICLVGGGQEINTGEAGIAAWLEAVTNRFPHWNIAISDRLTDSEYAAGQAVDIIRQTQRATFFHELHLNVSMRSFRSEKVSEFVKALLDLDTARGSALLTQLQEYPIVLTRDLHVAKKWLREKARGTERYGLLASSKAMRLKPYSIDVAVDTDPVHYFLDNKDDIRSSSFLECVATEFQVQGLELDWACVAWDGDLRKATTEWTFHDFRGNKWQNIHNTENRSYLKNAYRVLLTRARQGMVIFVPHGNNPPDVTRDSSYLDGTYSYLKGIGIPELAPAPEKEDQGY
jgi:hypothetical protein